MPSISRFALPLLGLMSPLAAHAVIDSRAVAVCASLADNDKRLACFDQLAEVDMRPVEPTAAPIAPGVLKTVPQPTAETSLLAQEWELGDDLKRSTFNFRSYRPTYLLLANYSGAPNYAPFINAGIVKTDDDKRLQHAELMFQLSFKMKLAEDLAGTPFDLWFGYTQQSYWQAYNKSASSPFRETNYQPELMAVVPVNFRLPGITARFVNFGVVHQSNGQSGTLSRSWNRFYAQAGLEEGRFTLLARVWKRLDGGGKDDDNPDILDYMGNGDLQASYRQGGHEFSLLARKNFRTSRGATQLGWNFPLSRNLKGYVEIFSGYGQTLIDYNYSQKSIGTGVTVDF
jgi:phospholipase A1